MRKTGLSTIYEMAKTDKNIIFVGSDLGHKTLQEFHETLPKQFLMEGISEAHIVSMASGLAQEGFKVYINNTLKMIEFTKRITGASSAEASRISIGPSRSKFSSNSSSIESTRF